MKNLDKITTYLTIAVLAILLIGLSSCSNDVADQKAEKLETVELLQRGEAIQLGKEWEYVQNAYSDFTRAIKANPNDNKAKVQLAQLYIKEARVTGEHGHYYPGALTVLDEALENEKITKDLRFLALTTKAGVLLSLHEFEKALMVGNQAALLNPLNAQIHGVLVDANVELGNYDKAVKLADKMMAIKPDIRSYSRVSYLREIHGDIEGSIEAMTMAIKAGYPGTEETAWAMLTLGDIYKEHGELDKALNIYHQILEMRPNYPFAVGAIGEVELMQGKYKEAEQTLNQAMNIIPEVGFYISMAKLYKEQGRTSELEAIKEEILMMLNEDTDSGHNMNLEYANLYLDIFNDSNIAKSYALIEYEKRPKNITVNKILAKILAYEDVAESNNDYLSVAKSRNPNMRI